MYWNLETFQIFCSQKHDEDRNRIQFATWVIVNTISNSLNEIRQKNPRHMVINTGVLCALFLSSSFCVNHIYKKTIIHIFNTFHCKKLKVSKPFFIFLTLSFFLHDTTSKGLSSMKLLIHCTFPYFPIHFYWNQAAVREHCIPLKQGRHPLTYMYHFVREIWSLCLLQDNSFVKS